MKGILRVIVKAAMWSYFKIVHRMKVIGAKNVPKEGPIIFCANHTSYMDPPVVEVSAGREMRFLAKKELKEKKPMAFLLWIFDAILLNRNEKDIGPLKEALKELKSGGAIAIFPEGTRNGMEKGEKAKDGVAFLAVRSGAKVVPCGIKGGKKGDRKVVLNYGKPLDFSEFKGTKDKEKLDEITKTIMEQIVELSS